MTDQLNKRFTTLLQFPGRRYLRDGVDWAIVIDDGSGILGEHRLVLATDKAIRVHNGKLIIPAYVGRDRDRTTSVACDLEEGLTVAAKFVMAIRGQRRTFQVHIDTPTEG